MFGELPLSRSHVGLGRPAVSAVRRHRQPVLARRSPLGLIAFALLILFCLFDLNAVGYQLFGVIQLFSYVILVICAVLLLVYRFTVYRDLGPAGRIYFLFLVMYVAIGTPIGLNADPAGLQGRWQEVRLTLATGLIVSAAAVGARGMLLAYGLRRTLQMLFALSALIPLLIWISSYFPEIYRVEVGKARNLARATGTFGNPNEAAGASCMVAAVIFSFMLIERAKILSIAALAVTAMAVYSTGSRAGIVIFLALSAAQIFVTPGLKRLVLFLVGGVMIAGIILAAYKFTTTDTSAARPQITRMQNLLRVIQGDVTDETTGGRFQLAKGGIDAWMRSPLLGNGLGTQRRIDEVTLGPHNMYIRVGGEAGVIPLALFLLTIASLFWYSWNCHVPAIRTLTMGFAVVFALLCLASHSIVNSREHDLMIGICFGLLAGCLELQTATQTARRRSAALSTQGLRGASRPALGAS